MHPHLIAIQHVKCEDEYLSTHIHVYIYTYDLYLNHMCSKGANYTTAVLEGFFASKRA